MPTFQAPILNSPSSSAVTSVGEKEIERRRLALQQALVPYLSADQMAHTVRLCEQEFSEKMSISVSEFCQRLFESMPQIQLDKDARLRLLRAMRQPRHAWIADAVRLTPKRSVPLAFPEPREASEPMQAAEPIPLTEPAGLSEPIALSSPEDSTSPELLLITETPPTMPSPEDSVSPESFVLRYAHLGKDILG